MTLKLLFKISLYALPITLREVMNQKLGTPYRARPKTVNILILLRRDLYIYIYIYDLLGTFGLTASSFLLQTWYLLLCIHLQQPQARLLGEVYPKSQFSSYTSINVILFIWFHFQAFVVHALLSALIVLILHEFQGNNTSENDRRRSRNNSSNHASTSRAGHSTEDEEERVNNLEETPASPSPPVSPDSATQCAPIIIPTERNDDFPEDRANDDKSFAPEETEVLTIREPIIIPTERMEDKYSDFRTDEEFTEWDLLEESEKVLGNRSSWPKFDVASAVKLICDNLPQRLNDVSISASHSRNIPTVPIPSLGCSRRLTSVLEKNGLSGMNVDYGDESDLESTTNVPDMSLQSPDIEVLSPRKQMPSPKPKEFPTPKEFLTPKSKPPKSLLVSPPPVLTEPPLSMEDLAELLQDEVGEKASDKDGEKRRSKMDEVLKLAKDREAKKDPKSAKNVLFPLNDADKECRKPIPTLVPPVTQMAASTSKAELRFADNYEKHGNPLYQRRAQVANNIDSHAAGRTEADFRVDTNDFYKWQQMPQSSVTTEFTNSWPPAYTVPPNPAISNVPILPVPPPMPMHQELWNVTGQIPENHLAPRFPTTTPVIPLISQPQEFNQQTASLTSNTIPTLITPPVISPTQYPIGPQFRNFQENIPYEAGYERQDFTHNRQLWDASNRINENPSRESETAKNVASCDSSSAPSLWGRHYGQQRAPTYDRNRIEVVRTAASQGARRAEWSRDTSDVRFIREVRALSERDPRLRADHPPPVPVKPPVQPKDITIVRDPRLAKDKPVPVSIPKEVKEKDPRVPKIVKDFKVSRDIKEIKVVKSSKDKHEVEKDPRKRPHINVKKKVPKPKESHKHATEKSNRKVKEREREKGFDEMRSPLESLYGVIDTKAKAPQGSGLQRFKIPKLNRTPAPSIDTDNSRHSSKKSSSSKSKSKSSHSRSDKEEATAEVTSSSDGRITKRMGSSGFHERWESEEEIVSSVTTEETNKTIDVEADSISNVSMEVESSSSVKNVSAGGAKKVEEVTQELIEALIRKSLQSGEGKKLFEQTPFFQTLSKTLKRKTLKKIKRIIESESESSSSDEEGAVEAKKSNPKKKRRVIVSDDSSEEEPLANRIGNLSSLEKPVKSHKKSKKSSSKRSNAISKNKDTLPLPNTDNVINMYDKEDDVVMVGSKTGGLYNKNEKVVEKVGVSKEIVDDYSHEDKSLQSRSNKSRIRRRNSLEMLQEDVREMFICEDVVNATGHRMCRQVKENGSSSSNAITNSPPTKKKDLYYSDKVVEKVSQPEEQIITNTKQKNKAPKAATSDKPRGRGRKSNKAKSKEIISSDSEEDQPLALRSELLMEDTDSPNSDVNVSKNSVETGRRKGSGKDVSKEPKVLLEKADAGKVDSRMMFDSSSDESFGIDVSELAAAVDISLHPEKQAESLKQTDRLKKATTKLNKQKSKRGRKAASLSEDKMDDTASFTDDTSMTSDISMISNATFSKRSTKATPGTNEELLSNILVGLVDRQDKNSVGEKGSDVDGDDDLNESPTASSSARKPTRKKKKRGSWQLGIVSKKKRKKAATPNQVESSQSEAGKEGEPDKTNEVKEEVDTSIVKQDDIITMLHTTTMKMEGATVKPEDAAVKAEDSTVKAEAESTVDPASHLLESTIEVEEFKLNVEESAEKPAETNEPNSTAPEQLTIEKSEIHIVDEVKQEVSSPTKSNNGSPKKTKSFEDIEKVISTLGPEQLMDYTWSGHQKYTCLLCLFVGKNIVHHYKMSHSGKEIMISRLTKTDAEIALNVTGTLKEEELIDTDVIKLYCRFCTFTTDGKAREAKESLYEHLTTHTGEYRFKCLSCNYESVARNSMKTHYYKVCRRPNQSFADSIYEASIPKENGVFGYLCSACNFVQLKMDNTQLHLNRWHANDPNAKIVKINMSKMTEIISKTITTEKPSETSDLSTTEHPEVKVEAEEEVARVDGEIEEDKIEETEYKWDPTKSDKQKQDKRPGPKRRMADNAGPLMRERNQPKIPQKMINIDNEAAIPTENLNAFVCPPELEHTEVELQLERKKKMQEIIEDIGMKFRKDSSIRGFSITDKLKDIMQTDLNESEEPEESSDPPLASTSVLETFEEEKTSVATTEVNVENSVESVPSLDSAIKIDTTDVPKKEEVETFKESMDVDSEHEASDNENTVSLVPMYDSDSSSEQSESESADVNMILKETSGINASSKDPMMTTIQRLAAQLKNVKPLETASENLPCPPCPAAVKIKQEPDFDAPSIIPEPPSVVPISTVENLEKLLGSDQKQKEIDDKSSPKNFIRLRRLSGDMLSIPTLPEQEDAGSSSVDESNSSTTGGVLHTDTDEECSFLKIENVVSLAPAAGTSPLNTPIITNIRKAVEKSPVKNISILKTNSNQLFLKRISPKMVKNFSNKSLQPIATTAEGIKLYPVKIPSVSQATTSYVPIIPKPIHLDSQQTTIAKKLKSSCAYAEMLKPWKLLKLFKCMSKDCSFSTNFSVNFHQHYLNHAVEYQKNNMPPPYDYQKCPYCYVIHENLLQLTQHIEESHGHCRYQCNYCFYRAVAQSYVTVHQKLAHPGSVICILTGKNVKTAPVIEIIKRRDFVLPFICHNVDCRRAFYVADTFATHLRSHYPKLNAYQCHICELSFPTYERLIGHYKVHGLGRYQCLYCLNGTDSIDDIHKHLSLLHPNRLPQILERNFTSKKISLTVDVLDQLAVKNLEEHYTPEAVVEIDSEVEKEEKSTEKRKVLAKDVKIETNNPVMSNPSGSKAILSQGNRLKAKGDSPDSAKTDQKSSQILPEPELQLVSYKETDAVDPLAPADNVNYCDEFVSINVLDNPGFLKNINRFYDQSFSKSYVNDKNSDSDIEILENIESPVKNKLEKNKTKEDVKIKIKSDDDNSTNKDSLPDIDKNESAQSISCSTENSNASNDVSSNPPEAESTSKKPLTLDDIKGTGFFGEDLYKCGNENCTFKALTAASLKEHLKECANSNANKSAICVHCGKSFLKIGFLLEHIKIHGLRRFGCSLCVTRFAMAYQAISHIKTKHKYSLHKMVPADPKNPSADGLFIIQPVNDSGDKKKKKRKSKTSDKNSDKKEDVEKFTFNPDEIDLLPRQAIYNREVQCAVCPYTTKVRTNIIRHLQLHAKDESVPESGPVNPVPCLDKKERMFDKMVNLASSSHQNGRMGAKLKEPVINTEEDAVPKFVPEHKRYVCGVAGCNYLTVDEAMLRYHLKALHSEEPYFRCPHCPPPTPGQEGQNIAIDKMGIHLKMHDARLYKCSHCNHHHYHRHVVERHLSDKHPENRPFVKVIREMESTDNVQQVSERDENEDEVPDPDGNHWKCNMCDYKCVYKADMMSHATNTHDEKCQFKCTLCNFKNGGKIIFDQHISSKHADNPNADYIIVYQRIKGVNKKSTEATEPIVQDEPFDTTPLWRRDMPRIRHIRGILLEEEDAESSKSNKRKSEEQLSGKPAKVKASKSGSLEENKQCKEKIKRSLSCEKISETSKTTEKEKAKASDTSANISNLAESDVGLFGPYGKPIGNMYACTLCNQFKTKYKHDMRDHLYRELNYTRWHCNECGYLSVSRTALLKHFGKRHEGLALNHKPLSPDNAIEQWVNTLLVKQTSLLKLLTSQQSPQKASSTKSSLIKSPTKIPKSNATSPDIKDTKILKIKTDSDNDYDSKDEDDLVIDLPEDDKESFSSADGSIKAGSSKVKDKLEKPLQCKHCNMKFTRWRGFKLHVQIFHLKRLGYLCPYCDRSTNSEHLMSQHIKFRHPGQPETIIENPAAGGPELTDEFWEKEYGIVCPKRSKKRKRKQSMSDIREDDGETEEGSQKCKICGFSALSYAGLKSHMRIHVAKNLKCTQCTFATSEKAELYEHWELNHPHMLLKEEIIEGSIKKQRIEDYSNDIEEELVQTTSSSNTEKKLFYSCIYCNLRSEHLNMLEQHWRVMHQKSDLPFKYKKVQVPFVKLAKSENNVESTLKAYIEQSSAINIKSDPEQEGWICQWCEEFCDSESKMTTHQNMFHSHLPSKFKKTGSVSSQDPFTCKYCEKTFKKAGLLVAHSTKEHSDQEIKKNTQKLDVEVEKIMKERTSCSSGESSKGKGEIRRVARKSTTKSSLKQRCKAVARKSTNSFPRYSSDTKFNLENQHDPDNKNKQFSYYKTPIEPVNLAKINTYMVVGGHRMKVNCTTLTQFMNINPTLGITDLKYDVKYSEKLKQH
ncbi:uncharacterized protein [Prorops nasuta]|uniref:uncharacterized protein n=1 Tax=Prorops nasuta TaxID=863751 RepID=UPI0034CF37F4